jgi:hypothetical protein
MALQSWDPVKKHVAHGTGLKWNDGYLIQSIGMLATQVPILKRFLWLLYKNVYKRHLVQHRPGGPVP